MDGEHDLRGYEMVDADGRRIGRIENAWRDQTSDRPSFATVRTGWLLGRNHAVPLADARVEDGQRTVSVPYRAATVRDAPHLAPEDELGAREAQRIWEHYFGARDGERVEIPLRGERIDVQKRVVDQGGVRLRKEARLETVYKPVEVWREHVVVEELAPEELDEAERRAAGRDDQVVLRRRGEEPVLETHPDILGAVRATRVVREKTRDVLAQRRFEDVEATRGDAGDSDEPARRG